jgi:hypothetical protein
MPCANAECPVADDSVIDQGMCSAENALKTRRRAVLERTDSVDRPRLTAVNSQAVRTMELK